MAAARIKGVLSPVVTPFKRDLSPDVGRFIAHCKWLLSQDCGLAVFGTNSEANSMSADERMGLLESIVSAGVPTDRMMPGTGACSINEAAKVSAHATKLGVAGVLMLPPFYYKGVPEEGLFRFFSEVVQRVGDARLRVYLYHIPPVSAVPITHKLVERLMKAYPKQIAGMKDSSDDWPHTKSMIDAFAKDGFDVFSGNEKPLIDNIKSGGAGCISATANINPGQDRRDLQEVRDARRREAAELDQRRARRHAGLRHDPGAEILHRPLRQRRRLDAGPPAAGRDRREGRQGHDRQARRAGLHHAGPEAGDGGGGGVGELLVIFSIVASPRVAQWRGPSVRA